MLAAYISHVLLSKEGCLGTILPSLVALISIATGSAVRVSRVWRAGFLAGAFALCGCAGIHPYNQAGDVSVRQIQTNFNQLDLTGFIDKARTNLDVLRREQLSASQESLLTEGDFRILSILESPSNLVDALKKEMSERMKKLTGAATPLAPQEISKVYQILSTNNYMVEAQLVDAIDEDVFELVHVVEKAPPPFDWRSLPPDPPPAEWTKGLSTKQLSIFKPFYDNYVASCRRALKSLTDLDNAFASGGSDSIHRALRDWQAAISKVTVAKGDAAGAGAALNKLLDQYTKAAQTNSTFWKSDYTNAIKSLANAVDELRSTNAVGANSAIKTKLDALDVLLQAAASGQVSQPATNDVLRAALVCATIPQLAGDVQAAANAFHTPPLSSLLIQKDILSAEKDFTARQVARSQAKVDLSFQCILLKLDELNDYAVILKVSDRSMGVNNANINSPFLHPMADFFTRPPGADRRDVVEAFTTFAIAWRGPMMQQEAIRSELSDLEYQTALDANEVALRMWYALLSTPINQLVAYYGSGFKPSEVADLIVKLMGVGDLAAIAARL